MKPRDILCDSGVLISLTAASLDRILYFFAHKYNVRFVIPPSVDYESVLHPLQSDLRRYMFSALRLKKAQNDKVVVRVDNQVGEDAKRLMNLANNLFYIRGKPLQLIEAGEAEVMCLAKSLGIEYLLLDERTTRMLIESPLALKDHLEAEFSVNVMVNKENLRKIASEISPFRVLRSSELVMLASEHGYFSDFRDLERKALEAALYGVKYAGCSISFDEISAYLQTRR